MPDLDRLANELDFRAVEMLRAIAENGSAATTSEIRDVTGLDNSQVRYRRRKLEELELITVESGQETAGGTVPPKVHELTDTAAKALSAGLYSRMSAPEPGNFEELVEEMVRVRTHVTRLHERVDDLETDADELRNDYRALRDDYRDRIDGAENVGRRLNKLERDASTLKESVEELDDKKKDKSRFAIR